LTARTKSYTVEVTSVDGDTGEFSTVLRIDGHEKRDYMDMVLAVLIQKQKNFFQTDLKISQRRYCL
jgi:hypothetical protein